MKNYHNTYVFELTDEDIILYNHKNKTIYHNKIPENIIKDNKIYDYQRLKKYINIIVNKYRIINNIFKPHIIFYRYEIQTPTEYYLLNNLFTDNYLIDIKLKKRDNTIYLSGNILYLNLKIVKNIKRLKGEYFFLSSSLKKQEIINNLKHNSNINILEYENSETILYDDL